MLRNRRPRSGTSSDGRRLPCKQEVFGAKDWRFTGMIKNQRQVEILRVVQAKGSSTIGELAAQLQVSGETIRRNVKALTENGTVLKVHGGIVLPDRIEEPPYQRRMQDNLDAKQQIAAKVAELVQDGDSLILD